MQIDLYISLKRIENVTVNSILHWLGNIVFGVYILNRFWQCQPISLQQQQFFRFMTLLDCTLTWFACFATFNIIFFSNFFFLRKKNILKNIWSIVIYNVQTFYCTHIYIFWFKINLYSFLIMGYDDKPHFAKVCYQVIQFKVSPS